MPGLDSFPQNTQQATLDLFSPEYSTPEALSQGSAGSVERRNRVCASTCGWPGRKRPDCGLSKNLQFAGTFSAFSLSRQRSHHGGLLISIGLGSLTLRSHQPADFLDLLNS